MKRRFLTAILGITALSIALFGVPLAVAVTRFVDEETTLRIERQAILTARSVPSDFATQADPVELPATTDGIYFSLYDLKGTLISGKGPPHADTTTQRGLSNIVADDVVGDTRIVAVPISANESVIGVIRATQSTAVSSDRASRIISWLVLLAIGVMAVGGVLANVVAGRLARPVRLLRDAAIKLGDGDFAIEMPSSSIPEIDEAGQALAATAQRLDDLVARERLFSADASHQLRTPLAGLRTAIETELEFPRPDSSVALREALVDIGRLEQTIAELLAIARSSHQPAESLDVGRVLSEVHSSWQEQFVGADRLFTIGQFGSLPPVQGRATVLRHALNVLIDNALNHGFGTVQINSTVTDAAVTITVSDNGPGFTPPSLVSKERADHHGFGLPLASRLVNSLPARLVFRTATPNPKIDIVMQRIDSTLGS